MNRELNAANTMLIVKNKEGKELGRIAATAPNAATYCEELLRHSKGGSVEYVEDKTSAMLSRMFSSKKF